MSLFSKKVAVNADDVVKFRESVASFAQLAQHAGDDLVNSLMEMEAIANQRMGEMERVADSYEQLYSSVKQLERDLSNHISATKAKLGNTPKELVKKGSDGTVKKTPNPTYKELETQLQKQNSRLSSVKELSWKVYNEVSHARRVASELASSAAALKQILPELQRDTRAVVMKTEVALHSLENNLRAIQQYLTFRFRV